MLRIGVDIGGTFTDFVVFDERTGTYHTFKVLSTPGDPADAVLQGMRRFEAERGSAGDPPSVVHGSTVATNAVLERSGARTALVTSHGFRDLLRLARQARPSLYDFFADPPEPIVPDERCHELHERVDRRGEVVEPLDEKEIEALLPALRDADVEAVAVCFLFSFLHPEHEARVASRLRAEGLFVSVSSEVLPEFREYERASTTALNAFVTPVLARYLGRLEREMRAARLRIMQSNGGSAGTAAARREGVRSILSGPAGGVVGALHVARSAGLRDVITFDMGGTSTDVSLARGEARVTSEAEIDGLPIRVPVIDLHTVGSGGGSLARVDAGGALRVGPHSAGSDPGPACYGRGGERATVTDANLVLGRLPPDHFLGGEMPLDEEAARAALERLAVEAGIGSEDRDSAIRSAALGVVRVANAHMERALRVISVERGHDPADFALVSFGGAGGLHAARLARGLGIRTVLVPPEASTLSALGMLVAPVVKDHVITVMWPGTTPFADLEATIEPLVARATVEVAEEGIDDASIRVHREVDLRYRGQSYEITVGLDRDLRRRFDREHERLYGHFDPEASVEIVNLRVRAVGTVPPLPLPRAAESSRTLEEARLGCRPVVLDSGELAPEVPLVAGTRLVPGHRVEGPAIVVRPDTTVFLDEDDVGVVDGGLNLLIRTEKVDR